MKRRSHSGAATGNPLLHVLMIVAGLVAVAAFVVFSILAFLVIASVLAVLAGVVGVRLWWQRRKLGNGAGRAGAREPGGSVIEGEYRRLSRREDERSGDA